MNKEHFNKLVGNYSELESQFKDLEKLMVEYPYSQPVRMLNVKSSAFLSPEEFKQRMALAAFYTTDRNVLRSLIEKGKVPSDEEPAPTVSKPRSSKKPAKKPAPSPPTTGQDAEELRAEVLKNLQLLIEQKRAFLKLSDLEEELTTKQEKPASEPVEAAPKKPEAKPKKSKSPTPAPAKTAKAPQPKSKSDTPPRKRVNKNELIDKFIAEAPRITPKKVMDDNQSDLSKASSELKEDLVSENLAVIFARQGKTSKAIEIYKKLIWKFPQKKASFAAQIEELKKKKG